MLRFIGMVLVIQIVAFLTIEVKASEEPCQPTGVLGGLTRDYNVQFD
jgi:hypothetical protein